MRGALATGNVGGNSRSWCKSTGVRETWAWKAMRMRHAFVRLSILPLEWHPDQGTKEWKLQRRGLTRINANWSGCRSVLVPLNIGYWNFDSSTAVYGFTLILEVYVAFMLLSFQIKRDTDYRMNYIQIREF